MKYFNDPIYITAGALTGNIVGPDLDVREARMFSFAATWTGTAPIGTLDVEVSNDGGTTFAVLSSDALTGDTGSLAKNFEQVGWGHCRMNFVFTSGVGTLEVDSGIKIDDIS